MNKMKFYKISTGNNEVIYMQAVDHFQLKSAYESQFKIPLKDAVIKQVKPGDFKFTVEVYEMISGIKIVGMHMLGEIKQYLSAHKKLKWKQIAKDITDGAIVTINNDQAGTVMSINKAQPFALLKQEKQVLAC